jgi:hypothetical protein
MQYQNGRSRRFGKTAPGVRSCALPALVHGDNNNNNKSGSWKEEEEEAAAAVSVFLDDETREGTRLSTNRDLRVFAMFLDCRLA